MQILIGGHLKQNIYNFYGQPYIIPKQPSLSLQHQNINLNHRNFIKNVMEFRILLLLLGHNLVKLSLLLLPKNGQVQILMQIIQLKNHV